MLLDGMNPVRAPNVVPAVIRRRNPHSTLFLHCSSTKNGKIWLLEQGVAGRLSDPHDVVLGDPAQPQSGEDALRHRTNGRQMNGLA